MAAGKDFLVAIFDIPEEGLKTFLIDKDYKVTEVKPTPDGFAAEISFHDNYLGRQKISDFHSFSSLSDPLLFDSEQ